MPAETTPIVTNNTADKRLPLHGSVDTLARVYKHGLMGPVEGRTQLTPEHIERLISLGDRVAMMGGKAPLPEDVTNLSHLPAEADREHPELKGREDEDLETMMQVAAAIQGDNSTLAQQTRNVLNELLDDYSKPAWDLLHTFDRVRQTGVFRPDVEKGNMQGIMLLNYAYMIQESRAAASIPGKIGRVLKGWRELARDKYLKPETIWATANDLAERFNIQGGDNRPSAVATRVNDALPDIFYNLQRELGRIPYNVLAGVRGYYSDQVQKMQTVPDQMYFISSRAGRIVKLDSKVRLTPDQLDDLLGADYSVPTPNEGIISRSQMRDTAAITIENVVEARPQDDSHRGQCEFTFRIHSADGQTRILKQWLYLNKLSSESLPTAA